MRITVVDVPAFARFELRVQNEVVGRASYHLTDDAMTLPHTEIDPQMHGRGLGTILVRGVLAAARERRLRVLPYCPFIRRHLRIHPEELDFVAEADRPLFGLAAADQHDGRQHAGTDIIPAVASSALSIETGSKGVRRP